MILLYWIELPSLQWFTWYFWIKLHPISDILRRGQIIRKRRTESYSLDLSLKSSFVAITRWQPDRKTAWGGKGSLQLAVWIFHQGSQFVISRASTTRPLGLFSAFGRSALIPSAAWWSVYWLCLPTTIGKQIRRQPSVRETPSSLRCHV